MNVVLRCTVRGCAEHLRKDGARWSCARGHSFDQHRTGYLNLLQPQDRRSKTPGDSRDAAAARRRLAEKGHTRGVHEAFLRAIRSRTHETAALLDVGCGEGAFLRSVDGMPGLERHGLDISASAVELAGRTTNNALFVIANADRLLPYGDQAFDVVTSIDARTNVEEFARVIRPTGLVLVAVPAADDLIELREHLYGERLERPRFERIEQELAVRFRLMERTLVRETKTVESADLRDLLTSTYRGFRQSERTAIEALSTLSLTLSQDILAFEPR